MDLTLTDDERSLRETARRFFAERSSTRAVRGLMDSPQGFDPAVFKEAAGLDWLGLAVPQELGGVGLRFVDVAIVAEECGRALASGPLLPSSLVAMFLSEYGSSSQHETWLPGLLSGEQIGAWAVAEPTGSWGTSTGTVAKPEGDDFVLNGVKRYVPFAHVADVVLTTAVVDGTVGCFMVPTNAGGVRVEALRTLDVTSRLCEVELVGVRVGPDSLIGAPDDPAPAQRLRHLATVLICAESIGGAEHMLEMTCSYAQERVQFGRPIGSFQAIKHKCSNMLIALEGARVLTGYAALAVGERTDDDDLSVSIAKAFTGEAYSFICQEGLQVHGGIGFTWEHDVHLYLRRAKANEFLWGSPRWHRERVAAAIA